MERIKQILTDNVSYITIAELNDLLERKDNLNPQESFMLGVNVGRTLQFVATSSSGWENIYTDFMHINNFMKAMMQEKPAIIKKDLKDTVRKYMKEIYSRADIYKKYDNIDVSTRLYNVGTELGTAFRGL